MASRCLSLLALAACHREPKGIVVDGELHEPAWNARAQRGVFVDDAGHEARPYSEIRLLRDGGKLYVGLYAADQDIRSSDAFELRAGATTMHLTPMGGPGYAVDRDGSLDKGDDEDEEWVVELALPAAVTEIETRRCDRPKSGGEVCAHWEGTVRPP